MSHIKLNNDFPGIVGLLEYSPRTAQPLLELAETLLRGPSPLSSGKREIIASSVSFKNGCHFCHTSHGASAAHHFGGDLSLIDAIKKDFEHKEISPKLRALLNIAHKVQQSGKKVTEEDVKKAREAGAGDQDIHDTVLIAATLCMYNRYVDGLGAWAPEEVKAYDEMGEQMAHQGYLREREGTSF